MTSPTNAREWIALSLVPKLGPIRVKWLRQQQLPWPEGWMQQMSSAQRSYLRFLLSDHATAQLDTALGWEDAPLQRAILYPGHPLWPPLLNELDDPPMVLWASGNADCLTLPAVAVVGSRYASLDGLHHALSMSRQLACAGLCVASGLAMGIDAAAHRGALEAAGATIGVLGCGIDVVYPASHRALYQQLLEGNGLILSEFSPGTPARAGHFPRRNRIITGLCRGVLVVEARQRSGSLVSARLALEQNREVFALPAALENTNAGGCLWLIQQGAKLVTCAADILEEYGIEQQATSRPTGDSVASVQGADSLVAVLGAQALSLDSIAARSQRTPAECQLELQWLELDDKVLRVPGGWIKKIV
ncbi:DNA-processing protein DprA [Carnimonas bestiolae]|uniref:DNA-processing protein DprA n=1 Tax=Carnimonas bestiolae TaxID=3402172 RepID=UPI003EDC9C4A